jgi:membrane protein
VIVLSSIITRLSALHDWAIERPYVGILVRAGDEGIRNQGKDTAASIAYYTLLSLFPLILGLVSIGGFFLKSELIQLRVNELILDVLPVSAEFVTRNIESLIRIRGAAGITSAIVLIWSGSKMVGALSRAINRALGMQRNYAIYLSSLRYFSLTLVVAVLFLLTLAVAPAVELLSELQLELLGKRWNTALDVIANRTVGLLSTGMLVGAVYALVPYQRLTWRELLPGLLVAALLIELGKSFFVWYVGTAANYDAVYGSVSSIIVLLIWLYYSARVVLFGAAVINVNRNQQ